MTSTNKSYLCYQNDLALTPMLGDIEKKAVFVDVDKESDKCRFAIEIPTLTSEEQSAWEDKFKGKFVQLRQSLFLLKSQQSALVSQVQININIINYTFPHKKIMYLPNFLYQCRALFTWRRRRNFCPECGSPMQAKAGHSHKMCTSCKTPQYPYTAPVGIALVENEQHSEVLLVRQPRHPPGMFSCLAGFVDAGINYILLLRILIIKLLFFFRRVPRRKCSQRSCRGGWPNHFQSGIHCFPILAVPCWSYDAWLLCHCFNWQSENSAQLQKDDL
jgi:hypothetical protein